MSVGRPWPERRASGCVGTERAAEVLAEQSPPSTELRRAAFPGTRGGGREAQGTRREAAGRLRGPGGRRRGGDRGPGGRRQEGGEGRRRATWETGLGEPGEVGFLRTERPRESDREAGRSGTTEARRPDQGGLLSDSQASAWGGKRVSKKPGLQGAWGQGQTRPSTGRKSRDSTDR